MKTRLKMQKKHVLLLLLTIAVLPVIALGNDAPAAWAKDWPSTDFSKHTVDLAEIDSTDIPKDGIPSISRPRFVSIKKARRWLGEQEPVLVVTVDNVARAYPLQIMIFHQIVNDTIKGQPLLITFCPLCNSALVFNRRVGSRTLTFGTTGKLRNSGLIMFDRQTNSWWQQFTATAIAGELAGEILTLDYSSRIISFAQFSKQHAKGKVLSRDTGFRRQYGLNPFQGYDSIDNTPIMFGDETDPRLPAMERVLNIRLQNAHKLYPYKTINELGVINDSVGNSPVVVFTGSGYVSPLDKTEITKSASVPLAVAYDRTVNGAVLTFSKSDDQFVDDQTSSVWTLFGEAISGSFQGTQLNRIDTGTNFAFAALAFKPDVDVYVE